MLILVDILALLKPHVPYTQSLNFKNYKISNLKLLIFYYFFSSLSFY